jgi:hypothetical protein
VQRRPAAQAVHLGHLFSRPPVRTCPSQTTIS